MRSRSCEQRANRPGVVNYFIALGDILHVVSYTPLDSDPGADDSPEPPPCARVFADAGDRYFFNAFTALSVSLTCSFGFRAEYA
jgi:hypothetical protein